MAKRVSDLNFETVEVKPYSQLKTSLGVFAHDTIPKGFTVEVSEEVADLITTEIVSFSADEVVKIYLLAMNSSSQSVRIRVQQT